MARIRSIKPEFWTSEQISECSPNARLLFIGLWNFCDDYGVHPASIMRLKMQVFPGDGFGKTEISAMMDELIENGLVEQYAIDGEQYWFVVSWDKHQRPDTKTGRYPRPDGAIGKKIRRTNSENLAIGNRTNVDHSPTEKEKEKEKEKENYQNWFEEFWQSYPVKKSKGQAEKAFQKLKPGHDLVKTMIRAIGEQRKERAELERQNLFVPEWKHASTWLNGKCWEDCTEVPQRQQGEVIPIQSNLQRKAFPFGGGQ